MHRLNVLLPHLKQVTLALSKVLLRKPDRIKCCREGAGSRFQGNPYFAGDEEVSPQFEWLKNRDYLITHAETMEVKKAEVLKRLQRAVEKLRAAQRDP